MKFGGTSLGDPSAIAQCVEIIREASTSQAERVVVVVSAMSGVTDQLREGALCAAGGDRQRYEAIASRLVQRHRNAAEDLLLPSASCGSHVVFKTLIEELQSLIREYARCCDGIRTLGEASPAALDCAMGFGERISAKLVAAVLCATGLRARAVDATSLIVTDGHYQNASPRMDETQRRIESLLLPVLEAGTIPVVTGYIGATAEGHTTTLGRGGSDYSAAIVGACCASDEVWIWTDVDGVMSADPDVVPEARTIEALTYQEASALASSGAKVLHPRTLRPLVEAGIPLRVKNTFRPHDPGTLIAAHPARSEYGVKAVTSIRDLSLLTVHGTGEASALAIAGRVFKVIAHNGTHAPLILHSPSQAGICLALPLSSTQTAIRAIHDEFAPEIARREITADQAADQVSLIAAVGRGLPEAPGVFGRIFGAIDQTGIRVLATAQDPASGSITMAIPTHETDRALRAIHPLTLGV